MTARILVADDEERIRRLLQMVLSREGLKVDEAADGNTALQLLAEQQYDLLILDLMLPEIDGWSVCCEVRKQSDMPILMLTARGEEYDRVLGFQLGADDYVVKPFSPRELVLRVKSLLRRSNRQPGRGEMLCLGNVSVDEAARQVRVDTATVALTPKEYEILVLLLRHPGQVFSREQLLELIWDYAFTGGRRTVDSHVKNLREKLAAAGASVRVATVWSVGYRLEPAS